MEKRKRGGSRRQKIPAEKLRVRIVAACQLREVTPKEIAEQEGLRVAAVSYHFRALEKEGWIHVCRTEPVRGGRRHYYTADRVKVITDREFEKMANQERQEVSEGILLDLLKVCREAHEEGKLDSQPDSHLSQIQMRLDKQGWDDMQGVLDQTLDRTLEIKVESDLRRRESGEEPIPTVVALAGFEGPASIMSGSETSG
jgi:DNA-binding transcriptional ArsR family regulator